MTKFIFVTGGVVSGLGKGIASASIGMLLKNRGYNIAVEKFDPYINVDPGTMSPYQHGEVFVTVDGGETDLDLGHYERFIDINLTKNSSCSAGQIYQSVINGERQGDYLGGTVQVVPHITNAIKNKIRKLAEESKADIVITEIGGTVGDIESEPFLEAIRQFRNEVGKENTLFVHLTFVPYLKTSKELKTKPTQHSVKELQRHGLQPDILICRTEVPLPSELKNKIALFCDVNSTAVFEGIDVESIYDVPINFSEIGIDSKVCELLHIKNKEVNIEKWKQLAHNYKNPKKEVQIALVGKYVQLHDAYLSVSESLKHAGALNDTRVNIKWIDAEDIEKQGSENILKNADGILVPGGFGDRGIEGKIEACRYARENNIPYFGICLGMQIAVIEFARNVCDLEDVNSTEFKNCKNPVIDLMETQINISKKGGTMRLGNYPCILKEDTNSYKAYGITNIEERHRHRFEFNNKYREIMNEKGFIIAGTSPNNELVEIVENKKHPWFVGVQFHPEFKSRLSNPQPLFVDFIKAVLDNKEKG